MSQINFVRQRVKKLSQLGRRDKKIFKIVTILSSFFLLLLISILGFRFYFLKQLQQVEAQQNNLKQQVKAYEEREKSFVLFVNKLETLSQLFLKRQDKQDAIAYFTQVFGPAVVIDQMAYDAEDQLLAFNLRSADVFALEEAFAVLAQTKTQDQFVQVSQSNLKRNEQGIYRLQVTVLLAEEKEQTE